MSGAVPPFKPAFKNKFNLIGAKRGIIVRALIYSAAGYISGSILFARVFGAVFKKDIISQSRDGNPGTANAFMYGGFFCGLFTIIFELLKGFMPVFLYLRKDALLFTDLGIAFVIAAPVLGHPFPIFYRFRGGKSIAVSFGSLLGLLPAVTPVSILAFTFLFFSLVLKIYPHYHRTFLTYALSAILMFLLIPNKYICWGFAIITVIVCLRLLLSNEEKEKFKVSVLWKR